MGVLRVVLRGAETAASSSSNANGDFGAPPPPGTPLTEYCDLKYAGLWEGPIPDQGRQSLIIIWTLVALATVFTALRFYAKISRLNRLWWDDWVLLAAWVAFLGDGICSQRAVDLGLGKYPCDVNPQNFAKIGLEGENLGSTFGMFATVWSKTAFAITLLRLTDGKLKMFVWFVIVSMNLVIFLEIVLVWAKCTPVEKTWNKMVPGQCWDHLAVNIYGAVAGSYSGVCDIILALLPWKLVWGLRMKKKEKFGVAIAMSMGVFAGATAFVKSEKIFVIGTNNFTYNSCELLVWAAAEMGTTIMAACIPVLRVFVRDIKGLTTLRSKPGYPKSMGDSNDSNGSSGKSPNLGNTAAKMPRPKTIGSQPIKLAALNKTLSDDLDSPTSEVGMDGQDDSSEKYILQAKNSPDGRRPPSPGSDTTKTMRTQEYEIEYHDNTARQQQDNSSGRSIRRRDVEHELGDMPRSRFSEM